MSILFIIIIIDNKERKDSKQNKLKDKTVNLIRENSFHVKYQFSFVGRGSYYKLNWEKIT
jgi:hypothetical protein